MSANYLVLGTGFSGLDETGKPIGVPKKLQVEPSKFEKNPGDKMYIGGVTWIVLTLFNNKPDAMDTMNSMTKLFIQKGYWAGYKTTSAKY